MARGVQIYKFLSVLFLMLTLSGCKDANEQRLQNLQAFTEAYGLIRWFYPSDEAQEIDWNQFALYGVSRVQECKSANELQQVLKGIFNPLAPAVSFSLDGSVDSTLSYPIDSAEQSLVAWQHYGVELGLWSNYYVSKRTNRPLKTKNISKAVLYGSVPVDEYAGCQMRIKVRIKKLSLTDDYHVYLNLTDARDAYVTYCANENLQPLQNGGEWCEYVYCIEVDEKHRNHAVFWSVYTEGEGAFAIDKIELENVTHSQTVGVFLSNQKLTRAKWNSMVYEQIPQSRGLAFKTKSLLFDELPHPGEVYTQKISPTLFIHVPIALMGDEKQTYPKGDVQQLDDLNRTLQTNDFSNREKCLADIVVTWNVINYFSPYLSDMELVWKDELKKAFCQALSVDTLYDTRALEGMMALLEDAHVSISTPFNKKIKDRRFLPFTMRKLGRQLVVKHALSPDFKPGDVILSVDEINASADFEACEKLVSAGIHRKTAITELTWPYRFSSVDTDSIEVKVNRRGKEISFNLPFLHANDYYRKVVSQHSHPSQWVKPNVLYLNLLNTDYEEVKRLLLSREAYQTVIVDIREGSRFLFRQIIPLISMGADTVSQRNNLSLIPQVVYPQTPVVEDMSTSIEPLTTSLNNLFLIGPLNLSNHEETLDYVRYAGLGSMIGASTGGCCGRINKIPLPSGGEVVFTGTKWLSNMGPAHYFYRTGIAPDVYVEETLADLQNGRDAVLEKALEIAEQ